MSTFAEYAMQEQQAVVAGLSELLGEILVYKPAVKDPAAMQMLTALQASLIAKRTQAGDALTHLRTATRLGEFKHISAPLPDRQRLASNDPTDDMPLQS
jgi:hypothetical protein